MRLLITGGTGFIGSHLAESALRNGHEVTVLGLADRPEEKHNVDLLAGQGANVVCGSVTDPASCDRAMEGVTHVHHLAVAMRESGKTDEYFRKVNLDGTRYLLEAAVDRGVERFVYCSTIGIFGHRIEGVARADSPLRPGNIYEETKVEGEALVRRFNAEQGLPVAIVRPADVYGPRDQRLLKLFRAVSRGRFPLFGRGDGRRHMVFVEDVVVAFERARVRDEAIGQAVIVAGPEVCTLRELLEEIRLASGQRRYGFRLPLRPMLVTAAVVEDICTAVGVEPPIYRRRMDFFNSDSAFDTRPTRDILEWEPKVGLHEGIARTHAAYREAGLLD